MSEQQNTAGETKGQDQNPRPDNGQTETKAGTAAITAAELEDLRKRAAERDSYLDLAQRTQADFQNYQKRQQREREQERDFQRGALVVELLPILDNLERAIHSARQSGSGEALLKGVSMVHGQFLDLLRNRFGVTPIEALGQPFDPAKHEALTDQPSSEHAPNTVIQVAERGYQMNERVLRPAKVVVASRPGS